MDPWVPDTAEGLIEYVLALSNPSDTELGQIVDKIEATPYPTLVDFFSRPTVISKMMSYIHNFSIFSLLATVICNLHNLKDLQKVFMCNDICNVAVHILEDAVVPEHEELKSEFFDIEICRVSNTLRLCAFISRSDHMIESLRQQGYVEILSNSKWMRSRVCTEALWEAIECISDAFPSYDLAQFINPGLEQLNKDLETIDICIIPNCLLYFRHIIRSCPDTIDWITESMVFERLITHMYERPWDTTLHNAAIRLVASLVKKEKTMEKVIPIILPPMISAAYSSHHSALRSSAFEIISMIDLVSRKNQTIFGLVSNFPDYIEFVQTELKYRKLLMSLPYGETSGDPVHEIITSNGKIKFPTALPSFLTASPV